MDRVQATTDWFWSSSLPMSTRPDRVGLGLPLGDVELVQLLSMYTPPYLLINML